MNTTMYIPKSPEWFIERIGKKIYRDKRRECCPHCIEVEKNGLTIYNKLHAHYLADVDMDFGAEGIFSNYRDRK
ncbi:MAG TPA: hypothetical protein ENH85_03375 [Candidatus Scalindua sp.]|nr:hypothetical protein [Candidatus Scalindua sp.]